MASLSASVTGHAGRDGLGFSCLQHNRHRENTRILNFGLWYRNASMISPRPNMEKKPDTDSIPTARRQCDNIRLSPPQPIKNITTQQCLLLCVGGEGRAALCPPTALFLHCHPAEGDVWPQSTKTFPTSLPKSPSHEGRCAQSTINIGLGALRAKHISCILLFFLKYALITIQFPLILNEFQKLVCCNTAITSLTRSDNGAVQWIEMLWFCPAAAAIHRTQFKFFEGYWTHYML